MGPSHTPDVQRTDRDHPAHVASLSERAGTSDTGFRALQARTFKHMRIAARSTGRIPQMSSEATAAITHGAWSRSPVLDRQHMASSLDELEVRNVAGHERDARGDRDRGDHDVRCADRRAASVEIGLQVPGE